MKRKLVVLVGLVGVLALVAAAQDTRVLPLNAADAAQAKAKYAAMKAAEKDWQDFQEYVGKKYTQVPLSDPDAGGVTVMGSSASTGFMAITLGGEDPCAGSAREKNKKYCEDLDQKLKDEQAKERFFRKGFEWGFVFDKDFLFLIPKPPELTAVKSQIPGGCVSW